MIPCPFRQANTNSIQEQPMITGAVKNKVDKIWLDIFSAGLANPLTVIEQLTYLMFIRALDVKELENENYEALGMKVEKIFPQTPFGQSMRWSKFKNKNAQYMFDVISQRVFPAIKEMKGGKLPDFDEKTGTFIHLPDSNNDTTQTAFAHFMKDAVFLMPTPQVLEKVVTGLEELYEHDIADLDMQGDLYEYMLDKLSTAGRNGQFRTPKHIRDMMVALLRPTPDDIICDPACGTAGFLISAAEYIRTHYESTMTTKQWDHFTGPAFTGYDTDPTMLRISAMNLMLHSIHHPDIRYRDSVSKENTVNAAFTMCLANPPFKGSINDAGISDSLKAVTNTKKTELLFLALFLRILKKGGQCACIGARRRALRQQQGSSVHTQGTCGASSAAGRHLHAFRRVQAVCGRIHRRAHLHQNRGRRHGQRLVLRHAGRRLFSGRQAHARGAKRHPDILTRFADLEKEKEPCPHGTVLLCTKEEGNCRQRLRSFHK